jgi:uncharacterized membrane protein YbhN (UPF0104 family)
MVVATRGCLLYTICNGEVGVAVVILFLLLVELYGLHMAHLSLQSILTVSIFMHLCEMFVSVRPSLMLFPRFFMLR